ncbi:swarming motility regulation protein RssB [mine drainage metagenome]|uniref:Swarming motility regulation protein RssB n=1 Tax=mine drainage metagenome TaxID=410659 RepID=A0A1J5R3Z8_9ZZZZ
MRILLIEDDPMIGQSLMRALNDAGLSGEWLRDGAAGELAIVSGGYALILLDLGSPDSIWAPTTIPSSPSVSGNCWRGSGQSCGGMPAPQCPWSARAKSR